MTALLLTFAAATTSFMGYGRSQNDDVLQAPNYSRAAQAGARATDILWPRSSFPGQGTPSTGSNGPMDAAHQLWEFNEFPNGVAVRKKITGTARDSAGAILASATVKLFNTATGTLVDTQTADASGGFTVEDPNNVACFIVAYKAGSPDVSGTTLNTLTGT